MLRYKPRPTKKRGKKAKEHLESQITVPSASQASSSRVQRAPPPVELPEDEAKQLQESRVETQLSSNLTYDTEVTSYRAASSLLEDARESDHGSDVEVPPLTMESGSEPEEEEEEEA